MRQGQNPAKMGLPAYQPKRLGLALLSYIPSQNAYFAQSLEILKYQIASVHHSTSDFNLVVFDNGSMPEVQNELRGLQENGLIDFLCLSRFNLGKTGALNWILGALPNEMIGFADGDVLFRHGWWEQTERIFSMFPGAGLVTAAGSVGRMRQDEAFLPYTINAQVAAGPLPRSSLASGQAARTACRSARSAAKPERQSAIRRSA